MLTVCAWLWTGRTMGPDRVVYTADHVNRLAAMVRRNLTLPHEVVCITDSPEGIDPSIRIVPLWDDLRDMGRCFVRLKLFDPAMQAMIGGERFVSIDLDTVVTGDLTPLFDRPEPFIIWGDPGRVTPYCGSLWMLRAGAHREVWDSFDRTAAQALQRQRGYIGSDQAWMSAALLKAPTWNRSDGIYSFRLHIAPRLQNRLGRSSKREARPLPENCRVVFFHGLHDPSQPAVQQRHPWVTQFWRT